MSLARIKIKRDTAAGFTASNIVLLLGEFAYETDSYTDSGGFRHYKFKIGDGATAWVDLAYARFSAVGGGGGTGDVVGPSSATDGMVALFDGTTGKLIKNTTAAAVRTLLNVENGATADQSAAEILAALLTVDGAGSGLDADLLDGQSSASFQPVDADLTAIAALTSAANKIPYATGSGTWALNDFLAVAQSLLALASPSAIRFYKVNADNTVSLRTAAEMLTDIGAQASGSYLVTTNNLSDLANAGTARTNLGGTTAGQAIFTVTNPSAITFLRVNADNTVTLLSAADFRTALALVPGTDVQAYSADLADLILRWVAASAAAPASLDFHEDTDNGSNKITVTAPASVASDKTLTLPDATDTLVGKATTDTLTNKTVTDAVNNISAPGVNTVGYLGIPQNAQSAAYTTVMADAGKHIYHPAADTNARTYTIDSNANVAYPIGTTLTFINETAEVVTIAITTDTLVLAGTGTTGSRSLAQYGMATAVKVTSTRWIINGEGLT